LRSKFTAAPVAATGGKCSSLRALALGCLGAAALLLSGCRLDMHIQPKYLPYEPTDFFGDGRS
jgi:hypothetical protein